MRWQGYGFQRQPALAASPSSVLHLRLLPLLLPVLFVRSTHFCELLLLALRARHLVLQLLAVLLLQSLVPSGRG